MPWKIKWCRLERRLAWILWDREKLSFAEITNNVNDNFGRNRTMGAVKSQLYLLKERREIDRESFLREIGLERLDKLPVSERNEAIGISKSGKKWRIRTEGDNRGDYSV